MNGYLVILFFCQQIVKEEDPNYNKYIFLFPADGAAHEVSQDGDTNIILVNVLMINSRLLNHNITSTQSHTILTFRQVCGPETSSICCTIYKTILIAIKQFDIKQLKYKRV